MICFNCGWRLPDAGVAECGVCGMKMPKACAGCGVPNPLHARHCLACGRVFPDTVRASALDPDVTGAGVPGESRRHVAVLFADVSGFTSLSETRDPETVRSLINDCFAAITRPVYALEGAIDKYIGDCVMVLFGARIPHADDAARAAACALRMQQAMAVFSRERLASEGLTLRLSIGVHYGLVVTGSVGNYYDKDYTVMGDTVNLAQRLQSAASAGTVLVSGAVRQEAGDRFTYRDMGEMTMKNRREPVHGWLLEAEAERAETREFVLVDREEPLNGVGEALSALMGGTSAIYAASGPSGIGKSALGDAWVRTIVREGPEDLRVLRVDCGADLRHRPHALLSALLHALMNLDPESGANARRYRMDSYGYYLMPDAGDAYLERMLGFLGLFMGLERDPGFQEILDNMTPEDLEREMVLRLQAFLLASLRLHPTLFVLDDMQWADDRSLTLLNRVLRDFSSGSGVWLFLYREDARLAPLAALCRTNWRLLPLGTAGIETVLCHLLKAERMTASLIQAVQTATQGNPLLVETYAHAVLRHEAVVVQDGVAALRSGEAPFQTRSLGNLLLAGLQELPPDTLAALQMAAVVGAPFPMGWLRELAGAAQPETLLLPAFQSGVLTKGPPSAGNDPMRRDIRFSHDMAREALYESLLHATRQRMHLSVATFLARMSGPGPSDMSALVSSQYEAAGDPGRAARHALLAAEQYQKDVDIRSAEAMWWHFLSLVSIRVPEFPVETASNGTALDAKTLSAATSDATTMVRWGDKTEVERLLGAEGQTSVAGVLRHLANRERADGRREQALRLLRQCALWTDSGKERLSLRIQEADLLRETGELAQAGSLLEEISGRVGDDLPLQGGLLLCKSALLRMRSEPGALDAARQAERIFRKTKDWRRLSDTMGQRAGILFARGEGNQARQLLTQAIGYAERVHDLHAMARLTGNLGILHLAAGDMTAARATFSQAVELSRKISNLNSLLSSQINLGILMMEQGRFDAAQSMLAEVADTAHRTEQRYQECLAWLNLGDLAAERDWYPDAREAYAKALVLAGELSLEVEQALCEVGVAHVMLNESFENDDPDELLESAAGKVDTALAILRDAEEEAGTSDALRVRAGIGLRQWRLTDEVPELPEDVLEKQPVVPEDVLTEPQAVLRPPASRMPEAIARHAEEALTVAQTAGNGLRVVKALRMQGILRQLSDDDEGAVTMLKEAVEKAEGLESDLEAAKSAWRLSLCLARAGLSAEASGWRTRAREHAVRLDDCDWKSEILAQN